MNAGVANSMFLRAGVANRELHGNQPTETFMLMLIAVLWTWGPRMTTRLHFPSFKSGYFNITTYVYM